MAGNSNIPLLVGGAFYVGWENAVAFSFFWIFFKSFGGPWNLEIVAIACKLFGKMR